jgi:hypothetical protein
MAAVVPTCTGLVAVFPLKSTVGPMSIVGLPLAPLPLVTLTFDDPAVIVRFAVTPGEVSTNNPVPPGSLIPPLVAQDSLPGEMSQQSPTPLFA